MMLMMMIYILRCSALFSSELSAGGSKRDAHCCLVFHGSRSLLLVFRIPDWFFMVPGRFLWFFKIPDFFYGLGGFLWLFMVPGGSFKFQVGFSKFQVCFSWFSGGFL